LQGPLEGSNTLFLDDLADRAAGTEAIEILRGLIERVVLHPANTMEL
jgi:hypothetical protein